MSMENVTIDIDNQDQLIQYLLEQGIAASKDDLKIDYCKGGVSSKTAIVVSGGTWYLVKQAREKLLVKVDWEADIERIAIEAAGNRYYHAIVPEYAPKVISYDHQNYIMLREAVPDAYVMWKSQLLQGLIDIKVAQKVVEVLAKVHNATAGDPECAKEFANLRVFYQLRISPYFEYLLGKYPELTPAINSLIEKVTSRQIALVHGDYSPKNILVDGNSICILDYEIAHYGDPVIDIAFLLSHITLKAVHLGASYELYLALANYMASFYFSQIEYDTRSNLEAYTLQLLGLFLLARVDGKSPVEYLVDEEKKDMVRTTAKQLLTDSNLLSIPDYFHSLIKQFRTN